MNFEINKNDSGILIIKPLIKNIDATVSTFFKSKVYDLIEEENKYIIFNFNEIDFIDSSGLGALVSILKTLSLKRGLMAICEVKTPILNLFKITRMDQVFNIFSKEEECLAFLIKKRKHYEY